MYVWFEGMPEHDFVNGPPLSGSGANKIVPVPLVRKCLMFGKLYLQQKYSRFFVFKEQALGDN